MNEAKNDKRDKRRTTAAWLLPVFLVVGMVGGFVGAVVLQTTNLTAGGQSDYAVTNSAGNWQSGTPTVIPQFAGSQSGTCFPSDTMSASAGIDTKPVNVAGGSSGCATGDFQEVFSFTSIASPVAGTDTFSFVTTYEQTSTPTTVSSQFVLTVPASSVQTQLNIELDFTNTVAPSSITSIQVLVTGA